MDPRRLRLLLELSRRGSMRAVADELGYTTSTVSQQLSVLAREAGTPLIEPAGRMVRLTPAGQRLADHAVTILAALEAGRARPGPAGGPAAAPGDRPAGRLPRRRFRPGGRGVARPGRRRAGRDASRRRAPGARARAA